DRSRPSHAPIPPHRTDGRAPPPHPPAAVEWAGSRGTSSLPSSALAPPPTDSEIAAMSTSTTARMPRAQRRAQLLELATRMFTEVRALGEVHGDTVSRVRGGLHRFYEFVALDNSLRLFTGHEVISEAVRQKVVTVLDRMAVELAAVLTASRHIGAEESRVLGRGVIAITQTTAQLLQGAEGEAERETILDTMTTTVVHGLAGFPPREDSPL